MKPVIINYKHSPIALDILMNDGTRYRITLPMHSQSSLRTFIVLSEFPDGDVTATIMQYGDVADLLEIELHDFSEHLYRSILKNNKTY